MNTFLITTARSSPAKADLFLPSCGVVILFHFVFVFFCSVMNMSFSVDECMSFSSDDHVSFSADEHISQLTNCTLDHISGL